MAFAFAQNIANPFDLSSGDFKLSTDIEFVRDTLEFFLLSRRGEWFLQPNNGSRMASQLFEQVDEALRILIENEVTGIAQFKLSGIIRIEEVRVVYAYELEEEGFLGIRLNTNDILVQISFRFLNTQELEQTSVIIPRETI